MFDTIFKRFFIFSLGMGCALGNLSLNAMQEYRIRRDVYASRRQPNLSYALALTGSGLLGIGIGGCCLYGAYAVLSKINGQQNPFKVVLRLFGGIALAGIGYKCTKFGLFGLCAGVTLGICGLIGER